MKQYKIYTKLILSLILITMLNINADVKAADSVVTDVGLKQCLNKTYLKRAKINDPITITDLLKLNETYIGIKCSDYQISDLTGIEYLTNLEQLYLSDNQLSNIEQLSALVNLEQLILANNMISNIEPLANLININTLDLSNNQVSNLDSLNNLVNLALLNLNANNLKTLNLQSNFYLIYLDIGNNQLSNLNSLNTMPMLTFLNLTNNNLSNLDALSKVTSLSGLMANNNQLNDLTSLSNLTNLAILHLSNNQINDVSALSNLTLLQELDLSNNQVTDLRALHKLNIKEFKITNQKIKLEFTVHEFENLNLFQIYDLNGEVLQTITTSVADFDHGVAKYYGEFSNEIRNGNLLNKTQANFSGTYEVIVTNDNATDNNIKSDILNKTGRFNILQPLILCTSLLVIFNKYLKNR